MKAAPWNTEENRALVALYFTMLDAATSGQSYNKAAMIKAEQLAPLGLSNDGQLSNRSRGSIEAKLMNASAAHRDLILETAARNDVLIPAALTMAQYGYKAWGNYQSSLKDAMQVAIDRRAMDRDGYRAIR